MALRAAIISRAVSVGKDWPLFVVCGTEMDRPVDDVRGEYFSGRGGYVWSPVENLSQFWINSCRVLFEVRNITLPCPAIWLYTYVNGLSCTKSNKCIFQVFIKFSDGFYYAYREILMSLNCQFSNTRFACIIVQISDHGGKRGYKWAQANREGTLKSINFF